MISLSGCFSGLCYIRADCFQLHKSYTFVFCQTVKVLQYMQPGEIYSTRQHDSITMWPKSVTITVLSLNLVCYRSISHPLVRLKLQAQHFGWKADVSKRADKPILHVHASINQNVTMPRFITLVSLFKF